MGREASLSGGALDYQIMNALFADTRGYDGGKRHIVVDTDGRLLSDNLIIADVSDSAGAQTILAAIRTDSICGSVSSQMRATTDRR